MSDKLVLVYQPSSYVKRGPAETCIQIVSQYPNAGLAAEVSLVRARAPLPKRLRAVEALPAMLRSAPWRAVRKLGTMKLDQQFIARLKRLDPAKTIIDIWPSHPSPILAEAKRLGFTTVRNMINCACARSRTILEREYERQGLPPVHPVTPELVEAETAELQHFDFIFSPSEEVDRSLAAVGIPDSRILKSSFGWNPERFAHSTPARKEPGTLRFLFVGTIGIRKGVPDLLEAWRRAALPNAELLLIGDVEPGYRARFVETLSAGARHLPHTDDLGSFYKSADAFVFPSLEEGAPQVVYEAAGCGAALIVTPMGKGRMVEPGINGLVVPPANVEALTNAIRRLAEDSELRLRLRRAAREAARRFEYPKVGRERARLLTSILNGTQREVQAELSLAGYESRPLLQAAAGGR